MRNYLMLLAVLLIMVQCKPDTKEDVSAMASSNEPVKTEASTMESVLTQPITTFKFEAATRNVTNGKLAASQTLSFAFDGTEGQKAKIDLITEQDMQLIVFDTEGKTLSDAEKLFEQTLGATGKYHFVIIAGEAESEYRIRMDLKGETPEIK